MAAHTFVTRTLSRRANTRMMVFLVGSALLLCVVVAVVPPKLREVMAWILAFVPAGGYVLLSWLYEREQSYTVSEAGLAIRSDPAHPSFTLIDAQSWTYAWTDITDFAEGDTMVLGRYGYLEIWVNDPGESDGQRCLRLTPNRRSEIDLFDEFAEAFRHEVGVLNADATERAVSVATIRRKASMFDNAWVRVAAVAVSVSVVAVYLIDVFTTFDEATEWRLAYLYLLLFPLALYALRRSFGPHPKAA